MNGVADDRAQVVEDGRLSTDANHLLPGLAIELMDNAIRFSFPDRADFVFEVLEMGIGPFDL